MRAYRYVGPEDIRSHMDPESPRARVAREEDVLAWIADSSQIPEPSGYYVATFVVDAGGELWIADRHSEHVACARNGEVLSAGEISFEVDAGDVNVAEVTNQSTGYCPEQDSWPAVANALDRVGIPRPSVFRWEFVFRLCPGAGRETS